jgi:hypothetical protein
MTGLFGRGCLEKVKRSELPMGTRVISSRFHYKIKRHSAGEHKLEVMMMSFICSCRNKKRGLWLAYPLRCRGY